MTIPYEGSTGAYAPMEWVLVNLTPKFKNLFLKAFVF